MSFLNGRFVKFLVNVAVLFYVGAPVAAQQLQNGSQNDARTGITTLYAVDPIAQSLCLRDGTYGNVVRNGVQKNWCSDIIFEVYESGSLTVAVEGGRVGGIIDVGTNASLEREYGFYDANGKTGGFVSIGIEGKGFVIRGREGVGSRQELMEASSLKSASQTSVSVPILVGHIYLLRLANADGQGEPLFAKLLVLSFRPGEAVTLRWEIIEPKKAP